MTDTQTVFVVDDDRDFRESLSWLLQSANLTCRAFESGEAFLQHYAGEPGCLLLDVRMAGMSGLALQQELNNRHYALPVIMITGHGDVAMAVQAMKNRAVDFIEKPFDDEALLHLVRETLLRSERVFNNVEKNRHARQLWESLSKREREVARLVVQGLPNRDIAETLGISIKTVEIHRSRVMRKMQAKNLARLVERVNALEAER